MHCCISSVRRLRQCAHERIVFKLGTQKQNGFHKEEMICVFNCSAALPSQGLLAAAADVFLSKLLFFLVLRSGVVCVFS